MVLRSTGVCCVSHYAVVSPNVDALALLYAWPEQAKHICAVQGSFPPTWRHSRRRNGVKVVCRGAATLGGAGCAHVFFSTPSTQIETMIRQFPTMQFLWQHHAFSTTWQNTLTALSCSARRLAVTRGTGCPEPAQPVAEILHAGVHRQWCQHHYYVCYFTVLAR